MNVGLVNLKVTIYDPSKLLKEITCWWKFGDRNGTWLNNTEIKEVVHRYTEDKLYHVSVILHGLGSGTQGTKIYTGSASLLLQLKGK